MGDAPEGVREELLGRRAERDERRGPLQAIIQVYVYANGECQPQVSFTNECALGPDSDPEEIARVVRTAQGALVGWR